MSILTAWTIAAIGIATGISAKALYDRLRSRTQRRITLITPVATSMADRAVLAYEEMGIVLDRYNEISKQDVFAIATRWSNTDEEIEELYHFLSTYLIP